MNKTTNLFCDIICKHINANPDTQFVVLYSNYNEFDTHVKFKVIHGVLSNLFINPKMKATLLDIFCKSQRTYHILSRFSHKYAFRKAKRTINVDLYLNPISENDPKTVPIFDKETRSVFLFTCNDLIHILISGLTHCNQFFVEPIISKNPYTNVPFHRGALFQIYFQVKSKCVFVPLLLDAFFQCDFDLELFSMCFEQDIRNAAAMQHLKNSGVYVLAEEVGHMLRDTKSRLRVDPEFPKDVLVSIMRPYLYLYMMFMYSVNGSQQLQMYNVILLKKLHEFFVFNPEFGKKKPSLYSTSSLSSIDFYDSSPFFTIEHIRDIIRKKEYMSWYSHSWENSSASAVDIQVGAYLTRINVYSHRLYRTDVDDDPDANDYSESLAQQGWGASRPEDLRFFSGQSPPAPHPLPFQSEEQYDSQDDDDSQTTEEQDAQQDDEEYDLDE